MTVPYPASRSRDAKRCIASGGIQRPWTRSTRRASGVVFPHSCGGGSAGGIAAEDVLEVADPAYGKDVLANGLEAAACVEALGAGVPRPHADPELPRDGALQPSPPVVAHAGGPAGRR